MIRNSDGSEFLGSSGMALTYQSTVILSVYVLCFYTYIVLKFVVRHIVNALTCLYKV